MTKHVDPRGKTLGIEGRGRVARLDNRGRANYLHDDHRNLTISRGPGGMRQVIHPLPGGGRVVAMGPHRGFVEHRFVPARGMRLPPGRSYVQRTYVVNNVRYSRVYNTYNYRGAPYYRYAPMHYYRPAFYGYAYRPWRAPVVYGWGWGGAPWYGAYPGFFAPAPAYPGPSLWLTDFLLAANLKAAYDAQQSAAVAEGAPPPVPTEPIVTGTLTPEVKQLIAQEIQAQMAEQQQAAAQPAVLPVPGPVDPVAPPVTPGPVPGPVVTPDAPLAEELPEALSPKHRVFIVSTPIDVTSDDQQCTLTPGDVITRLSDTPDDDNLVKVAVLSSKPGDCASGMQVLATVEELQDMYNDFREKLDSGLTELAKTQGTGGMPAAPADSAVAGPGEVPEPQPDMNADKLVTDENKDADGAEADLQKDIQNAGG